MGNLHRTDYWLAAIVVFALIIGKLFFASRFKSLSVIVFVIIIVYLVLTTVPAIIHHQSRK